MSQGKEEAPAVKDEETTQVEEIIAEADPESFRISEDDRVARALAAQAELDKSEADENY